LGSKIEAFRKKLWTPRDRDDVPPLGTREVLVNWISEDIDGESVGAPLIDMVAYGKMLRLLPDKVVENLEKARLERAGYGPMLKAGLGYEEVLAAAIVDGTAITSSSTEAFLFPALLFPTNYLQPGGIPGRVIRWRGRGRVSTIVTTQGTLTFKFGAALTNVIPTTTWAVSGAITSDAVAVTNSQWKCEGDVTVRSVGSAGTVFCQGDVMTASGDTAAVSAAKAGNYFMGSAGAQTPATATVDMTQPQYVSLTGKWSLTTAYSIQGHIFVVEALN